MKERKLVKVRLRTNKNVEKSPLNFKYELDNLKYSIEKQIISQCDGLTMLDLVSQEIQDRQKNGEKEAEKCGCANHCLECFQLDFCICKSVRSKILEKY